jgi:PhzF family phenazine biosynthesis protein
MKYFLIDAFSEKPFAGNPAAVCVLEEAVPDGEMAALAAEFGLSETAFVLREGGAWRLRWFSPAMEIPLCGHGTLATARALRELGLETGESVSFLTMAGELRARYEGEYIELDFPARPAATAPLPPKIAEALGLSQAPLWCGVNAGRNWLIDLGSAEAVAALAPGREATMALADSLHGIIATGRGDARRGADRGVEGEAAFSSRFFAPEAGVFEDPVTGSAHCALAPYWAPLLGRERFLAYQASARGGLIRITLDGERVRMAGRSAVVAEGSIRPFKSEGLWPRPR